jgi:RND family efflux transporter MFP subunit
MYLRALFLCGLALGLANCGGQAATDGGNSNPAGAMPPADVKTLTLSPHPVPRTSEFIAAIHSLSSTTIQPQVDGLVTRIFVRSGDRVRAGQNLVQIDPDRQQASVASLEAARAAREAEVKFAADQLRRAEKLLEGGAVSRQELDQAQTVHQTAVAQLAAIEAQIREARVELRYYSVTAPSAGIVGDIPIRQGDRVSPATLITTIDRAEGLEAYVSVPLERAAELRPGLPLELLDANGAVAATNPITFIAPRADDATQSVLVKARLRKAPPDVRILQYVRARIVWSNEPGLTVPVVAVNRVSGQYFVFVAEQSGRGTVARQKPISVAEIIGDEYVVRSGLNAGERVIVSNLQKLGDGAPVKAS